MPPRLRGLRRTPFGRIAATARQAEIGCGNSVAVAVVLAAVESAVDRDRNDAAELGAGQAGVRVPRLALLQAVFGRLVVAGQALGLVAARIAHAVERCAAAGDEIVGGTVHGDHPDKT